LSSRSLNLIKMSHGWYETHVLRSLKFDYLIYLYLLVFKIIYKNKNLKNVWHSLKIYFTSNGIYAIEIGSVVPKIFSV